MADSPGAIAAARDVVVLDQHVLGAVLDAECVGLIPDCAVVDVDVL